jgi:hypothetical protein
MKRERRKRKGIVERNKDKIMMEGRKGDEGVARGEANEEGGT